MLRIKEIGIIKFAFGVLLISALVFFSVWTADIIRCEILNREHAYKLFETCDNHVMVGPMEYIKVLYYDRTGYAKVYAVSEDRSNGSIFILYYGMDKCAWNIRDWLSIWSRVGSADGFIWPYFR